MGGGGTGSEGDEGELESRQGKSRKTSMLKFTDLIGM